jgi:hypothetical protein
MDGKLRGNFVTYEDSLNMIRILEELKQNNRCVYNYFE